MIKNFGSHLIVQNDSLLLAISGGIDSMVLLDLIVKLKEKLNLKLYIAHVDHQKRVTSKDDRDFVLESASNLNIPCFIENLEIDDEHNFHDYAHKKRYDFFYKIAKENNINKVVLAHNANDNAETILMRMTRGSSFEGYRGILESNYYNDLVVVRPLLHVSRNDIEIYQQVNLIAYQNDPTNDMDDYTRNRYRHHLLPLLEQENPRYLEKISQFSFYQSLAYDLVNELSNNFLENIEMDESIGINISELLNHKEIVQIEIIKKIINYLTNNKLELSFQNFIDILDMTSNEKPHLQFIIENELYVYKSYENLYFQREPNELSEFHFEIKDFTEIKLPNGDLVKITKKPNKNYGFLYELCYNNLDLVFPLTVRNRLNGDKLKTNIGTKKLKDVLIDKKVPILERNSLPVFLSKNDEIIFIPGIFSRNTTGDNELYILVQKE
ncbi:MAG: tRNA lysidine(34) synthetase TilS [Candidatus Izemoplasmatales bacterium]|nr:tRNA lysidine(34) synthetase TilS [Candidatus Izemoplasmatales bacterium]